MSHDALNAGQRAGVVSDGKPSYTVDQAAAQLDRAGLSWSAHLGAPAVVTYGFRADASHLTLPDGVGDFTPFSPTQIDAAQLALGAWSDVANVTFQRVGSGDFGAGAYTNSATILFANYGSGEDGAAAFAFLPGSTQPLASAGDVWVNANDFDNFALNGQGGDTLAHEIGHAIGLSHPADYDGSDTGPEPTYAKDAVYAEDSGEYTVMSYFPSSDTGGVTTDYALAPLLDDIAAAQRLYGANYATRAGDTVYGFSTSYTVTLPSSDDNRPWYQLQSPDQHLHAAIWDGGGTDTLNVSLYAQDQLVDLREGSFSNIGGDVGNVAIAVGAQIENAIGGSGADTLIGNALANHLYGGAGDDTLTAGSGDDTLDGGDGSDTAVIADLSRNAVFVSHEGEITVRTPDELASVQSVETIAFDNGAIEFDLSSPAAEIYRLYDTTFGRAPDFYGEAAWANQIAHGETVQQIADLFTSGAEFQARYAGKSDLQFVEQVYRDTLDREGDADGVKAWTDNLESGRVTRSQLIALFSEGDEHKALTASAVEGGLWTPDPIWMDVEFVYQAAFGRASDDGGLEHWATEIEAGRLDFTDLVVTATQSAEFLHDTAGLNHGQLVTFLYETALGRAPDPGGLAHWTAELDAGRSVSGLVLLFAQGEELHSLVEPRLMFTDWYDG